MIYCTLHRTSVNQNGDDLCAANVTSWQHVFSSFNKFLNYIFEFVRQPNNILAIFKTCHPNNTTTPKPASLNKPPFF